MNTIRKTSSALSSFTFGSNIAGATGMPRAMLRRLFSERGLFGAESALTRHEQAGIHAELQLPAGAVPAMAAVDEIPDHWRIAAIRSIARMVLRDEVDAYDRLTTFARRFGIEDRVTSEVARTVRTAMFLYGAGVSIRRDVEVRGVEQTAEANAESFGANSKAIFGVFVRA